MNVIQKRGEDDAAVAYRAVCGDGVAAGRRELAIFLVLKEQTKAG